MKCAECKKEISPEELSWSLDNGDVCQMCWEAYCSDEYWDWYNRTKGVFCNPDLVSPSQ